MTEALAILAVLAAVVYVWMIGPVRWFRDRHKGRPLPDVWV